MNRILAAPLTAEAFAPFGIVCDVTAISGVLPIATAFDATGEAPDPVLQLVNVSTVPETLTVSQLETHPFSAQTFLPLDMAPSLIVVCETGENGHPDTTTLKAFVARPEQIVTYNRGVLHHRLTPLKQPATYAMAMRHTGHGGDTVLYDLPLPFRIDIARDTVDPTAVRGAS